MNMIPFHIFVFVCVPILLSGISSVNALSLGVDNTTLLGTDFLSSAINGVLDVTSNLTSSLADAASPAAEQIAQALSTLTGLVQNLTGIQLSIPIVKSLQLLITAAQDLIDAQNNTPSGPAVTGSTDTGGINTTVSSDTNPSATSTSVNSAGTVTNGTVSTNSTTTGTTGSATTNSTAGTNTTGTANTTVTSK